MFEITAFFAICFINKFLFKMAKISVFAKIQNIQNNADVLCQRQLKTLHTFTNSLNRITITTVFFIIIYDSKKQNIFNISLVLMK